MGEARPPKPAVEPTSLLARVMLAGLAAAMMSQPNLLPVLGSTGGHAHQNRPAVALARVEARVPLPPPTPVPPSPGLTFTRPSAGVSGAPDVASLAIPGPHGSFQVPYIQTGLDLPFSLDATGVPDDGLVEVTLDDGTDGQQVQSFSTSPYQGTFSGLSYGEHTLTARIFGPNRDERPYRFLAGARLNQIGRGDIVAAMGDSTTEGYGAKSLPLLPDWLAARKVAGAFVTPDARNFPQQGGGVMPGTSPSFTTSLGQRLADLRGHPVLVLNEGWSGSTADAFTHVTESPYLRTQFDVVRPNIFLINLGVNDALVGRSPGEYAARMNVVVSSLMSAYAAAPADIHVACPSWAAQQPRNTLEEAYMPAINSLRASKGLGAAPNFFTYFRDHRGELGDAVHPNLPGYIATAALWADALGGAGGSC
jgi:lysophospholipase L1-like esterase